MKRELIMMERSYEKLLNIGIELSAQRNMSMLFDTIITEAMDITNCDAGTLYIYENGMLNFKIMRNHSMNIYRGGSGEEIDLPPVSVSEQNVCAYVVIHREMENIEDVYNSDKFDFAGPKKYDEITGYKTKSMMVIPLENNRGDIVGVLQLINAMDEQQNIIPFHKNFEKIFRSVASQAAIAVTNMKYTKDIKGLFNSLVQVLATAIDERTPYNSSHAKNVAGLSASFIDFLNEKHASGEYDGFFNDEMKEQIVMAAWLHDVGKITTPLDIMDKSTRLGRNIDILLTRFDKIYFCEKVKFLEGKMTQAEWEELSKEIISAKELCEKMDTAFYLEDENLAKIKQLGERLTTTDAGEEVYWLTPFDVENLSVKQGTLNAKERIIMENHVTMTEKLLSKIEFTNEYKDVPFFAASHHEKLNGRGYPKGLTADEMPVAVRLLAVMDVFDALTAPDRPYKKPLSYAVATELLMKMAEDGDLDKELVRMLKEQYKI